MSSLQPIADIESYIFSESSHVVESMPHGVVESVMESAIWFQVAGLFVTFAYLMWLNRWAIKSTNIAKSFHFLGVHRGGYSSKISTLTPSYKPFARAASFIGAIVVWLVVVRLMGLSYNSLGGVELLLFAIVPLICLYQVGFTWAIGVLIQDREFSKQTLSMKGIIVSLAVIVIAPTALGLALSSGELHNILVYVVTIQLILLVLVYVFETFLLFISKKVSTLHTILYLCTAEILPMSLIWGYFNR